jgi:hypothetical protein
MNPSKSLIIILTFIVNSLFTASVSRANETFLPPLPPKSIASVHLPSNVDMSRITLRLVIDKSGHPRKIAVISLCDQTTEMRLIPAVAKWQFTPATENGQPVEATIILPLRLVDLPDSYRIHL